jgi:prevent-host-death family protein
MHILYYDQLKRLVDMREIQASEAKTHLPQILDDVERGETLVITRHGRRIARIVPELDRRQEEIDKAVAGILEIRKRAGRITVEELLSARDEGRKP